jgi:hypothetical protein
MTRSRPSSQLWARCSCRISGSVQETASPLALSFSVRNKGLTVTSSAGHPGTSKSINSEKAYCWYFCDRTYTDCACRLKIRQLEQQQCTRARHIRSPAQQCSSACQHGSIQQTRPSAVFKRVSSGFMPSPAESARQPAAVPLFTVSSAVLQMVQHSCGLRVPCLVKIPRIQLHTFQSTSAKAILLVAGCALLYNFLQDAAVPDMLYDAACSFRDQAGITYSPVPTAYRTLRLSSTEGPHCNRNIMSAYKTLSGKQTGCATMSALA